MCACVCEKEVGRKKEDKCVCVCVVQRGCGGIDAVLVFESF